MQVEQLIQLLQQRSPKQDICVEIFGTQFEVKDVEINNDQANGVKISICVDDTAIHETVPTETKTVVTLDPLLVHKNESHKDEYDSEDDE